jgi:hypothetical protein
MTNPKLHIPNPNGLPTPKSQTNFQVEIGQVGDRGLAWELFRELGVGSGVELGMWSLGFD